MEDNKMAEDVRKQLEERLRKSRGELPGGASRALPSGAFAERLAGQQDAPLYVIVEYDVTGSMEKYLQAVRGNVREVSERLFDEETGINIAVWGVGDHIDGPLWLQTNGFASTYQTLDEQLRKMRVAYGEDAAEAYECAFKRTAMVASKTREKHASSKIAVVFIGDSIPHGMMLPDGSRQREYTDNGCPEQVDYRQTLPHLKATTDLLYLVGCSPDAGMTALQRTLINPQSPNERFIPLGDMVSDLPALLIAAIKQARDPVHMEAYLRGLGSGERTRVAGYLGLPPGK